MSEKVKQQPNGFPKMLHELSDRIEQTAVLYEKINIILTLNDRIPLEDGIESLSDFQLALYEQLQNTQYQSHIRDEVDNDNSGKWMTLGIKGYGRIVFSECDNIQKYTYAAHENGDIHFGFILIPNDIYEAAFNLYSQRMTEQKGVTDAALQYMREKTPKELDAMVHEIHFVCYHMAPVLYYIESETITNFYDYNNFIKVMGGNSPSFLLDDLIGKPINDWSIDHCLFIYSLHFLLQSGPPARGEEFNGKLLNPVTLLKFLNSKWDEYDLLSHDSQLKEEQEVFNHSDIPQKSKMLADTRARLSSTHTFYRRVNGLNLLKKESLYPSQQFDANQEFIPEDLQAYFSNLYNIKVENFKDVYPAVRELIHMSKTNISCMNPDIMSPIEELLHFVVDSAVRRSNADMGMTRSLRDFSELIRIHDNNLIQDACQWKQNDFFCCVVPSSNLVKTLCDKGPVLPGILKSVSIRMQFNSWHYTPGNFPRESVPDDRHFYFPPVMPDTAVWSDQHHRGHIHASVRYSIRSPYHIMYKGKRYSAFFDLRLMRQKGDEFTLEDMQTAVRYTLHLNQIYQAILDAQAEKNIEFKVTAFTKEWYDTFYGPGTIYKEEVYAI